MMVKAPAVMFQPSSGLPPDIADFCKPADEPCQFGEPPAELLAAHHRPFVNRFWRRIKRTIDNPVEVDTSLGIRRVQILGMVIFEFAPDGYISVQGWISPPEGPTQRVGFDGELISILHVPHGDRWLQLFREGFRFELQRTMPAEPKLLDEYTAWLYERIRYRVRHECNIGRMRRRVAASLMLNPLVLEIARRVARTTRPDGVVTVANYNAALSYLSRIEAEMAATRPH